MEWRKIFCANINYNHQNIFWQLRNAALKLPSLFGFVSEMCYVSLTEHYGPPEYLKYKRNINTHRDILFITEMLVFMQMKTHCVEKISCAK